MENQMKTYMELAKAKETHEDFVKISQSEGISVDDIMHEVAAGRLVIIPNRGEGMPIAIGNIVRSKVLCNFGTSSFCQDIDTEIEKVRIAVGKGAAFVCDQSVGDHVSLHRKKLIEAIQVPIASVPLYQNADEARTRNGNPLAFSCEDVLEVFEQQIKDGVTAPGIHTMNKELASLQDESQRLMPVVSRGVGILKAWMRKYNTENPYLLYFLKVLSVAKQYNVPITFVSSCRSGTVVDGFDECQIAEWKIIGEYIKIAHEHGVFVVVDGLGHMSMDQIPQAIKTFKEICFAVPLGVLGPAVTDRGLGHEHVVNAIGTATAVWHGANYCNACYCTEHLRLPELQDIAGGISASLIAVNSGDLARSEMKSILLKEEMKTSEARRDNKWGVMIDCALDKEEGTITFKRVGHKNKDGEGCSICGDLCPFVLNRRIQK
jgi:phosphomethylpyrimidine synthase